MPVEAHLSHPVSMRSRFVYGCCAGLVIALGLIWRSSFVSLPGVLSKYGGDALWSLMVFLGFGFWFPNWSTGKLAGVTLVFSFTVETSQLYHAPWIDAIRETRLGGLVLGSVFNWPDFLAYSVGVLVGGAAEMMLRADPRTHPASSSKQSS